ncbi:MAG: AAA family ATPase [Betaproteobacteria bacterium]
MTADTKFRGDHGSPEHKAHIARIAHSHEVHDVIEAVLTLNDTGADIEDRAAMARYLDGIKEDMPAAYSEGVATYEKALADASILTLKARRRPFSPEESRVGDVFSKAPPAPPFVIERLLPRAHGVENATGGAGKTTRHIWEAAHVILGRDLYGLRVHQPGAVLIVTKEDDSALFRHRIYEVISSMPDLSAEDRKRIADSLHLLVLTGTDERLAIADRTGNLRQTDLAERISTGYEREGLALVEFDPFNLFGPGERFVNDGEASALSAMANISQALKCAVRATSHVSKAVNREGTSDAHSGRGGSAGGDNSRFVWNYWRHDAARDKGMVVPSDLAAAADAGELYQLHVAKLTAARPAMDRIWIVRQGFAFRWQADTLTTPQERRNAAADADAQRVLDHLRNGRAQEGYYTASELEAEAATIGIGGKRVRAAVRRLRLRGQVAEKDLPAEMRQGGRKTYLEPAAEATAPLDTGKPIVEQIGGDS